jgi:hypothetical protein
MCRQLARKVITEIYRRNEEGGTWSGPVGTMNRKMALSR